MRLPLCLVSGKGCVLSVQGCIGFSCRRTGSHLKGAKDVDNATEDHCLDLVAEQAPGGGGVRAWGS